MQDHRLIEENKLLRRVISAAQAAATTADLEAIRARARRNTPWYAEPPSWAK